MIRVFLFFILSTFLLTACVHGQAKCSSKTKAPARHDHPRLMLTTQSVEEIRKSLGQYPLLDTSVALMKHRTLKSIQAGMDVPVPKDAGGGYTHECHKHNAQVMYEAGILYQLTQEESYAVFIRDMLMAYGKMYPSLPLHPKQKEQSPGRLFWQDLNENVWLVYAIQGYDCIYNWLTEKDRKTIEQTVFIPVATFLSEGSPATFNMIHNHGTWAVAGVGMTGYVTGNAALVEKSLKGLNKDGKGGFLAQLDNLFSPDGYYTEGAYYHRYALMPFILYAQVIQNNEPERNILYYRDSILNKAVEAALQLTYVHGEFFPLNDALKEKTWLSPELVYAVDVVYAGMGKNPQLLDIAAKQGKVIVSREGLEVARDVHHKLTKPFQWKSLSFTDGAKGDEGGVGILRSGKPDKHTCVVMEYAAQGMGHGHYDRLGMMLYDNGYEVIQDYGSARFLNIEAKYGGHYLKENNTWAKQSVAHNTLVVDEQSHFNGKYKEAQETHARQNFFDSSNPAFQVMSGTENSAYPGISFNRTIAMLTDKAISYPLVLDILDVQAEGNHTYDLPYYYLGHFINADFEYEAFTDKKVPVGKAHGYQHLWKEGQSKSLADNAKFTWLKDNRFYTITTTADSNTSIFFTRIGANDPDFNLRNEPAVMIRQSNAGNHTFFSIIESHGMFDATEEKTSGDSSAIKDLKVIANTSSAVVVRFSVNDKTWQLGFAREHTNKDYPHNVETPHGNVHWTGPYQLLEVK